MSRQNALENNLVVNGHFPINMRRAGIGAKAMPADKTKYNADRHYSWSNSGAITAAYEVDHVTGAPTVSQAGFATQKAARIEVTTADAGETSFTTGRATVSMAYDIEGLDWQRAFGKPLLVYFWTRTNKSGLYPWWAKSNDKSRNYIKGLNLNGDSNWQRHAFIVPPDISGNWLFDEGRGLGVGLTLSSGPDNEKVEGWQSDIGPGDPISLPGQVQFSDTLGNFLEYTNYMILPGNFTQNTVDNIDFIPHGRNHQDELNRCLRYFETHKAPNDIFSVGSDFSQHFPNTAHYTTSGIPPTIDFKAIKRIRIGTIAAPFDSNERATFMASDGSSGRGASGRVTVVQSGGPTNVIVIADWFVFEGRFGIQFPAVGAFTAGYNLGWQMDAEIQRETF